MTLDRLSWEQALAVIVGFGSAALVYLTFEGSEATDCYRETVAISVAYSDVTLPGCDLPPFDAVQTQLAFQRDRMAADDEFLADEPELVKGKATLVVWMSLFAATAISFSQPAPLPIASVVPRRFAFVPLHSCADDCGVVASAVPLLLVLAVVVHGSRASP